MRTQHRSAGTCSALGTQLREARSARLCILSSLLVAACSSEVRTPAAVPMFGPAPIAPPVTAPVMTPVAPPPMVAPVAPPVAPPMTAIGGTGGSIAGAPGGAVVPGMSGPASHSHDDCVEATPVAPEDAMVTNQPEAWMSPRGNVDLLLPKPVQSWMDARLFKEGHDGWHSVRRCKLIRSGAGITFSGAFELCDKPALVAETQECEGAQDGYQFLVTHRHMIKVLRQAFPTHQELFAGFPKFPLSAQDVPEQWRARFGNGWSPQIKEHAMVLENIESNLARFPTEGDLGQFIQCGMMTMGASSVHGAMHFKWVVNGSPVMLGDSATNLGNYMFWKLHGWIDDVWSRYRKAKGLPEADAELTAALTDQCREMHMLGHLLGPAAQEPGTGQPLPDESGTFDDQVRPILEDNCAGCHSGGSPEGGLVLGGRVSSAAIVGNLVNVASSRGGRFKRVVARDAMQSWLYLKASGKAASAGCTGMCNNQVMPPTGMVTLTATELSTIERWIMEGAPAPTTP